MYKPKAEDIRCCDCGKPAIKLSVFCKQCQKKAIEQNRKLMESRKQKILDLEVAESLRYEI